MEKNIAAGKMKDTVLGKDSQIRHLRKIVKGTKISLFAGLTLLVLFLVSAVGFVDAAQQQVNSTKYLNQYRIGSKALTSAVRCYAVTGEQIYYDAYMQELNVDKNRDIAFEGLKACKIKDSEWDELNNIVNLSNGLVPLEEDAMNAVASGDIQAATDFVFGVEYTNTINQINDLTEQTISDILERLKVKKSVFLILEAVFALLFVIGFIKMILQSFKTIQFSQDKLLLPILEVSTQMTSLAEGDLHNHLNLVADDSEVGKMVEDISTMKENLQNIIDEVAYVLEQMSIGNYKVDTQQNYVGDYVRIEESLQTIIREMRETVSTICTASSEIECGAVQLADAAEDLANSCTSQAGQVSDIAILMDELEGSIKYNEKEAEEAVKISNLASSTLLVAGEKMTELQQAMEEINICSTQITSVTGAISELADEIEMLSLNASIESARAGEAGRGFAVVAEQVKRLAEASQEAAGQTSTLIRKTSDAVEKGTRIVAESAVSMEEVQMGAEETVTRISTIVEKLKIEVESIDRLNENINQIVSVVDNNSATSEETAAIGEQQKSQVEAMVHLMSKFKI